MRGSEWSFGRFSNFNPCNWSEFGIVMGSICQNCGPIDPPRSWKRCIKRYEYCIDASLKIWDRKRGLEWRPGRFFNFHLYNRSEFRIVMGHIFKNFGPLNPPGSRKMYLEHCKYCVGASLEVWDETHGSQKRFERFCIFTIYFSWFAVIRGGSKLDMGRFTKNKNLRDF